MARMKMPKKPKIGASQSTWDKYELKMKKYVEHKNEIVRRNGLKEKLVSKIKIA